jgi:hypothetical protein
MIIGKTRTNIRAEIDSQYEILYQMIEDIADHYQEEALRFEEDINRMAEEDSDGDEEIKHSLLSNFCEPSEKQYSLTFEARKILFCAIFSYFESMLYGLIDYFKIPRGKTNQVGQLIDKVEEEYLKRYSEPLLFTCDKNVISGFYRPLRNKFTHGHIGNPNDRKMLFSYLEKDKRVSHLFGNYEINCNIFLRDALNNITTFLVEIEEAYCKKERNCNWSHCCSSRN